jgi:predicted permease
MWLDLCSDVRQAARSLRRNGGFATTAIATIALGVGVNTGIFTVLNGVLFRGLPAPDAHELVSVYQPVTGVADREGAVEFGLVSTAEYRAYRERTRTLSGLTAHSDPTRTTLGGESPQETWGLLVACGYFDVLRQPPAIGRNLRAEDCETGADPVVVLGHELWTTAFAADQQILGRTVELNRQLFTVVGVAAEGTYGGFIYRMGYFAPISSQPLLLPNESTYGNEQSSWLFLIGRRNDGASLEQVRAELEVIAAQLDPDHPGRTTTISVERATPFFIPSFREVAFAASTVVMVAFGLVLLIACANVANLQLARATARTREVAVRVSLGSTRARLIRQLLTESLLISFAGGALGAVLALWSFQLLVTLGLPSILPVGLPSIVIDASPDLRVLMFTVALTLGTGIVFGLAPALRVSKPDLHTVMKQDAFGASGRESGRLQNALIGAQVAVCMVLMIAAGLLLRGLSATQTIDPGFVYSNVAVATYDLAGGGYDSAEAAAFQRQLLGLVRALPGVEAAAYAIQEPLSFDQETALIRLPTQDERDLRQAALNTVTPGYFDLIGTPIVRGRSFTEAELTNGATVAIVTETTARRSWPGLDAIGQTLLWRGPDREIALQVVGVTADAQITRLGEIDPYYVYVPASTSVQTLLKLLVKSRTDFRATASGIESAVRSLDPGLWARVRPLEANLERSRTASGVVAALAASLGALALVLAFVGIYGVVSYFVSRRFREIGIRMALGARSRDVLAMILARTMRPVVIGAAIGTAAGIGASRVLSSVLFGVSPFDLVGVGGATLFVLCIGLTAGVLGGRRGARVDPMVTLRYE